MVGCAPARPAHRTGSIPKTFGTIREYTGGKLLTFNSQTRCAVTLHAAIMSRHRSRMTDSRDKRAAEIQGSIRQILFREWDPIGVNENEKLADEYDAYIAPVYRILVTSHSEQELIDFLYQTERDTIGMPSVSRARLQPVARRLLELDVRL